jgi:isocitrate dehydrogenase
VLGTALKSHAERAGATGEKFHGTAQEFAGQDEENASGLSSVIA